MKNQTKEDLENIIELDENTHLLKGLSPGRSYCTITHNDKEIEVPLGIIAEIMDMRDIDEKYDDEPYPFIIEFSITSLKFHKGHLKKAMEDYDNLDSIKDNENLQIMESYRYGGGVPFNIESVTSGGESLKSIDSEIRTIKHHLGSEIKVRYFREHKDCIMFIENVASKRIMGVLGLVGFYLDQQINLAGHIGWSVIESQRLNKDR